MVSMARQHAGTHQINMFIPDLHSFTTPIDHRLLQDNIMRALRVFVAAGLPLDNPDVHIYRQSYIPAHSELTWILDCFTGIGEMNRMTQYKDKSSKLSEERISVGLFNYPVLMASDILLYDATYVPVGDDQTQHLEFTRDIAVRLNGLFGDLLMVPKPVSVQHEFFGREQGLRIKDLADPSKKMSKSDETGKGVIFLNDTAEVARKKIMAATTDSIGKINYDNQNQPGVSNLIEILALLQNRSTEDVLGDYADQSQYGPLKSAVADAIGAFLSDFQQRLSTVDDQLILSKLEDSEKIMKEQAENTLLRVQKAVGLR